MSEREKIVKSLRACIDHKCDECPWFSKCEMSEAIPITWSLPPVNLIKAAVKILEADGLTMEGIESVISGRVHRYAGDGFQVIPEAD